MSNLPLSTEVIGITQACIWSVPYLLGDVYENEIYKSIMEMDESTALIPPLMSVGFIEAGW